MELVKGSTFGQAWSSCWPELGQDAFVECVLPWVVPPHSPDQSRAPRRKGVRVFYSMCSPSRRG